MKLPSCPRTLIINILRKHPDGLTLTSIAQLTGLHRHTATKYVYELKGAGIINERDVGSAKLCYLKEGLSKEEQKKVVGRLNGTGGWNESRRKSSTGQVQILSLFVLLFLIPATVIIAQNATQSINSTGELILEQPNFTKEAADSFAEINITNETSIPIIIENQTVSSEQNNTVQENTIPENLTVSNETNATISEPVNETENITLPESENPEINLPEPESQPNITITEITQPVLNVKISSPDKTLRGEQFDISAVVKNSGNSDAKNVILSWGFPSGFEMVSGDSEECGTISPGSECVRNVTVSSSLSTDIGKNQIKVIVKYEK
ncbi:MAG: NEW3 domain-containing protein [Candidatus Aenigmarchaeota archaeon]|nr:NEW3 domain-containing protein [Candidatus Aenigmarchaeota archaeon]